MRGPCGTYMAPNSPKSSKLIYADLVMGQTAVRALVDSGAEASCCGREWYERHCHLFGGLQKTDIQVVGVEEKPIRVTGRTNLLDTTWGPAKTKLSLLVVPSLVEQSVIFTSNVKGLYCTASG